MLDVGVDSNLHPLQYLEIFFGEIQLGLFRFGFLITGVWTQANFEAKSQFHLVPCFTKSLYRFSNLGRVLDRFVYRGADFLDYLFCVVINFQFAKPSLSSRIYDSRRRYATRAKKRGQLMF